MALKIGQLKRFDLKGHMAKKDYFKHFYIT